MKKILFAPPIVAIAAASTNQIVDSKCAVATDSGLNTAAAAVNNDIPGI